MGEKKYLYTDYAQSLGHAFDVLPSYTKKSITEQEREKLRNKTKKTIYKIYARNLRVCRF